LNRVIRTPELAAPTELFSGSEPRFFDESAQAVIDQEIARAFEAGRREGFAAGRSETIDAARRVEAAIAAALDEAARLRDAAVDETIESALAVAEFVLGAAVVDARGPLADRICSALADIDDAAATVFVSPVDWDAIAPLVQVPPGVTIERDPSLRPGDARIRGPWASVDLTTAAALERAREALT
jgi:flagellar biosynthesis/type III secretory pathway protein FliH